MAHQDMDNLLSALLPLAKQLLGKNGVCYAVAGVRGGLTGPAAEVLVRFGNAAAQGAVVQAARAA